MHTTPTDSPEPFPREPIPPELLAWAQQTFDTQEFLEGVREIKATGGRTFESLIAEVETLLRTHYKDYSMRTELYWIEGPWRGRLAIMPRPRGGDWLEDEIQSWYRSGVDVVVSLLTRDEQSELNLPDEEALCRANNIEFVSFPIVDRSVPSSAEMFSGLVTTLAERLADGKNVAVHCRQGIGRAALVAISVLIWSGLETATAMEQVGVARGCTVPETPDQRRWISDFARSLVTGSSRSPM